MLCSYALGKQGPTMFYPKGGKEEEKKAVTAWLPQGFFAAGDIFTSRYDDKVKNVDDTLLHSENIKQSFWDTWDYIKNQKFRTLIFRTFNFGKNLSAISPKWLVLS